MNTEIKLITENEYPEALNVITKSFSTVANEFNLTKENAPTNPAFFTADKLFEMQNKHIIMYGLYEGTKLVGFIAIEPVSDGSYCIERLSVLPEYRHHGYGIMLMNNACAYIKNQKGNIVKIAIINENLKLKNWYKQYGFIEISLKKFEHLPFTVCFLEKKLSA